MVSMAQFALSLLGAFIVEVLESWKNQQSTLN